MSNERTPRRGVLLIVASPSGAGKTSLCRRLMADHGALELSISMNGPDTWMLVRDLSSRVVHRQLLQRVATLGASLPGLHDEEEVLRRVFEGLAEQELSYGYLVPDGERVWLGHAFVATGTAAGEARLTGQHLVDGLQDGLHLGADLQRAVGALHGPQFLDAHQVLTERGSHVQPHHSRTTDVVVAH